LSRLRLIWMVGEALDVGGGDNKEVGYAFG